MSSEIIIEPLSAKAFAPFGDLIELADKPTMLINQGLCGRHHDLADLNFSDGTAGISLFDGTAYSLPLSLSLVERHPLGSQAFLPMTSDPFLVIVAADNNGVPDKPQCWLTNGRQGVNYHRNTWHGVLTPLNRQATFAVVDRIGDGNNLEEHLFGEPWTVIDRDGLLASVSQETST